MSSSTTSLPTASTPTKITLSTAAKTPTQPHTNPITNLASTPNSISTGSLLALNERFIVYAVKNGLVRVMDRHSSLRTLLRGHKERISDVSFFQSSSDVLASVSDGDCRVWRVFGREDELGSETLLEIQKDENGECSLERVVWHPFNPNQFALLHKGSSIATFVETTRLMTTSSSEEGQTHSVCQMKNNSNVDGMFKFIVTDSHSEDAGVNDLAWSFFDARHVLTAHRDGCVRLWDLRSTVYILDGKEVDPSTVDESSCSLSVKCVMTVKVSTSSGIERCFFLKEFEDACAMFRTGGTTGMEPGSFMTNPFITYASGGEVALWSPFTMSGSPPTIVRIFKLENRAEVPSNVSVCTLPPSADGTQAPSAFILISDAEGNINAIHLASQWRDGPTIGGAPNRKIAAVTGFDYAVYFKSLQPIYSHSVTVSLDESSDVKQWNIDLFCVQSKAVQKLTLSPTMCAASAPLESGMLPDGVTVEDISNIASAASSDNDDEVEFDEYEEFEEADESFEEVDGDYKEEVVAEAVEAPPPPPMPSFLGGDNNSGAFSNWLGNLASASKKEETIVPEEPAIISPKSDEIDLGTVPLPEAPDVDIPSQTSATEFLSPMQILGMEAKKEVAPTQVPKVKKEKVKEIKDKKASKSTTEKKTKASQPSEDKKFTILKREDVSAKKTAPVPSVIAKEPVVTAGGVSKEDIEQIVRKAVSSHFQKQESIITAEIQKAVRYEVQSGLVPALNRTVSQTLEQTVAKTMKATVTKTMKENMKANSTEIASSISSKLQEPVVDSFHKTMRDVMVPAYESGTRQMFEQISSSIETALELKQNESNESAKQMEAMVKRMDAMGKTIEVLIKAVAQLHAGSNASAQSAPRPQAATDKAELLRKEILELLEANEYEKAFTQALSVSNSAMALFVCKHSDLSTVLEGATPTLSQPIMLCLMQQLGADLSTDENLHVKIAWLQSMALTLDPQNMSIKKHIGGVVQQLVNNLQNKIMESEPTLRRHLQMLLQVIRGIGNS